MPGPGRGVRRKRRSSAEESAHFRIVVASLLAKPVMSSSRSASELEALLNGPHPKTRAPGPRGRDPDTWTNGRRRLEQVHVATGWCGELDVERARGGRCRPMGRSACLKG